MSDRIKMASPLIEEDDIKAVTDVLKTGVLSLGPKQKEFEDCFKNYLDKDYALAVSSGTTALHLALLALGVGPGDEVLVPSYTFIASVNVILYVGAIPVFVDVTEDTYCFCVKDAQKKMSDKTKALIAVDVFGHPANWPEIVSFAKKNNLYTIGDSCEALGAEIAGQKVGHQADISSFAFYPNKQITTGEGGMLVTDNKDIYEKAKALCNQGRSTMGSWLSHEYLGYNYRIDEMSAALGVSQFKKLDKILSLREKLAQMYNNAFEGCDDIKVQTIEPNVKMSWFVYVVEIKAEIDRKFLIDELAKKSIPARAYFSPIHEQPYLKDHDYRGHEDLPITQKIKSKTVALPFSYSMNEEDVKYIVSNVLEIINNSKKSKRAA